MTRVTSNMKRHIVPVLLASLFLFSCSSSVTMTGQRYPPVSVLDVQVSFTQAPDCNYEELAFINSPWTFGQNSAIEEAREAAAEIGADSIQINRVTQSTYGEYQISAIAYKCGFVDREGVDLAPGRASPVSQPVPRPSPAQVQPPVNARQVNPQSEVNRGASQCLADGAKVTRVVPATCRSGLACVDTSVHAVGVTTCIN